MADRASALQTIHLTAPATGERLDRFVAAALGGFSRTEVQRLIRMGRILVNGKPAKASRRLASGDALTIVLPSPEPQVISAEPIPLDVIYEDADLVAINKPAGMAVHPSAGNRSRTVVNAALARWPEMRRVTGEERAGVVHRLDKGTSGVLLLAKTPTALRSLQQQFKERTVYKRYFALVEGVPASSGGLIEAPIGRDPRHRKRMAVVAGGRPAITRYDVLEALRDYALLSIEPRTGRTHQIRVHLAWLGHPVVGDTTYGPRRTHPLLPYPFLHAAELHINSPSTDERLKFAAPLPEALTAVLATLRRRV